MKKNMKKMIVILGIVTGFSCMAAIDFEMEILKWVPKLEYDSFLGQCTGRNGRFMKDREGIHNGVPSVKGICVCQPGYVIDYSIVGGTCVRIDD